LVDRDSEQIRADTIAGMGPDLGGVFLALQNDLNWMHAEWALYRQLYADSGDRVQLLNDTAPFAFYVFQETLWHDVALHLARLVDSKATGRNENLSLMRLPDLLTDLTLRGEVIGLLDEAALACAFCVPWRHKRLAHRDLEHALATAADPLPGISRADIESALKAIRKVMNHIEYSFFNSSTGYEHIILGPGDGDALAGYLKRGLKSRQEWLERLKTHTYGPEDLDDD
jgi:hypothetical protein